VVNRDGFEASMLEAKAKAKARPAKVVFMTPWKFTLHNFGIKKLMI